MARDPRPAASQPYKRLPAEIPFGSTILISGPPGAGKTTFALSMARSAMFDEERQWEPPEGGRIVYFISSEINLVRLQKMFAPLGWFPDCAGDGPQPEHHRYFLVNGDEPDQDNLYVVAPEPATDRPVPSPEELINSIFNRIAKIISPSEAEREKKQYLVIVDSITALFKGTLTAGDQRRQTHEMLHRLRGLFGSQQLALTLLLAEQDAAGENEPGATPVEDYLAEIVFRLSHKALPLGRRGRGLEIVKSQGLNMIPGDHTWMIVTDQNARDYFRHDDFKKEVEEVARQRLSKMTSRKKTAEIKKWGTIAVFHRPRLQYPAAKRTGSGATTLFSGTPGLDQMLIRFPEYWLPRDLHVNPGKTKGIRLGTTTLVTGPIGAGKTRLCQQFIKENDPEKLNLFINLSIDPATDAGIGDSSLGDHVIALTFTQSNFDFNHLMSHLDWALARFPISRIAFDGLSEWLTMLDRAEAAKMLEAVSMLIANHPRFSGPSAERPTVFMTFEMATEADPLAPRTLGVDASNIVALKLANIQDEIRKVIYILKSADSAHDQSVRELAWNAEKCGFEVRAGLDSFNGLLRGRAEPAEVLLQLFQENETEHDFNVWLHSHLRSLSNLSFKSLAFSRAENGRMLEQMDSQTRFPPADLKLLSVDEWWLEALPDRPLPSSTTAHRTSAPLLDLSEMWKCEEANSLAPTWNDFWAFEVEKAGPRRKDSKKSADYRVRYAVPGHMDYGLFCLNLEALRELLKENPALEAKLAAKSKLKELLAMLGSHAKRRKRLREDDREQAIKALRQMREEFLDHLPRAWVKESGDWFSGAADDDTIVGLLKGLEQSPRRYWGFSFDLLTRETCVCMFFELAWAFGAEAKFWADLGKAKKNRGAVEKALKFLMFLVLEEIMPARATVETTRHSLFSRHFYSTLQSVGDLQRWDKQGQKKDEEVAAELARENRVKEAGPQPPHDFTPPMLMALPFFPIGMEGSDLEAIWYDAYQRLHGLYRRWVGCGVPELGEPEWSKGLGFDPAEDEPPPGPAPREAILSATIELRQALESPRATRVPENFQAVGTVSDIMETARWHFLRMDLLCPETKATLSQSLASANEAPFGCASGLMERIESARKSLQKVEGDSAPVKETSNPPLLTGYCCTGSWLYAVHGATRSPSLARDLLEEMTSIGVSEERARRGAGIPVRKDFFAFRGEESVPGMEYLSWNQLLRSCAIRSLKRERVLYSGELVVKTYPVIHKQILSALSQAESMIPTYKLWKENGEGEDIGERFGNLAKQLAESIQSVVFAAEPTPTPDGVTNPQE